MNRVLLALLTTLALAILVQGWCGMPVGNRASDAPRLPDGPKLELDTGAPAPRAAIPGDVLGSPDPAALPDGPRRWERRLVDQFLRGMVAGARNAPEPEASPNPEIIGRSLRAAFARQLNEGSTP